MTEDAGTQMRFSGIRAAWVASAKAPVLGHGPGLLYEEFRTYFQVARAEQQRRRTVIEGYLSPMEPHNTYAFLAAEHGYPALLLFIGIMVICWRRTQIPRWRRLDIADQTYRTGFQALWLAWFAGMWVHSSLLVHLKVSLMFWLFAGIGLLWRACLDNEQAAGAHLAVPSAPPLRGPLPAYAVGAVGMSTTPAPGPPGDSGPERPRTDA
jgi:O-antigen ligase